MKKANVLLAALCVLLAAAAPIYAADASGTALTLVKTTGTVSVANKSGTALKLRENMKLSNGNSVTTGPKSYAYISLGDGRAVKLDEDSEVEVRKSGSKLEIDIKAGKLFFDVKEPLKGDEELTVKTPTIVTSIRGTSGEAGAFPSVGDYFRLFSGHARAVTSDGSAYELSAKLQVETGGAEALSKIIQANADSDLSAFDDADIPGFVAKVAQENALGFRDTLKGNGFDGDRVAKEADARLERDQAENAKKLAEANAANAPTASPTPTPVTAPTAAPAQSNEGGSDAASSDAAPPPAPPAPPAAPTFTVTFKDADGTVLATRTVEQGADATAPATLSTKPAGWTQTWDAAFTNVTADVTVTAVWAEPADNYVITAFTDANFASALQTIYGPDYNKYGTIKNVTTLSLAGSSINSLDGIEYFTDLAILRAANNSLSALDLSNNAALRFVDVNSNSISTLDLSNNTALEQLVCRDNSMSSLNLRGCTVLASLDCSVNTLTELDLRDCTALAVLNCLDCRIATLNLEPVFISV